MSETARILSVKILEPLYPQDGGPALAYACTQMNGEDGKCRAVTRTKKGMWSHLRVVHGIRKQAKLRFEESAA